MFIWIVIAGGITSFIASMGIGSNDAANAFAKNPRKNPRIYGNILPEISIIDPP